MLRLGGPTKLAALSVGIVVSAFHQHMVVGTDVSCHILFVVLGMVYSVAQKYSSKPGTVIAHRVMRAIS